MSDQKLTDELAEALRFLMSWPRPRLPEFHATKYGEFHALLARYDAEKAAQACTSALTLKDRARTEKFAHERAVACGEEPADDEQFMMDARAANEDEHGDPL